MISETFDKTLTGEILTVHRSCGHTDTLPLCVGNASYATYLEAFKAKELCRACRQAAQTAKEEAAHQRAVARKAAGIQQQAVEQAACAAKKAALEVVQSNRSERREFQTAIESLGLVSSLDGKTLSIAKASALIPDRATIQLSRVDDAWSAVIRDGQSVTTSKKNSLMNALATCLVKYARIKAGLVFDDKEKEVEP